MRRLGALPALALLAACSGEEPSTEAPLEVPEMAASTPAPAASPPAAAAAELTQVPATFLGKWDYVDGQCAIWSDAQLTVEPGSLTFYESTGTVTAVRQPDANTMVVTMAMSGEGDTWEEETTYRLLQGGAVLESSHTGADGQPFRRKRCEAFVDVPMTAAPGAG